MNNRVLYGPIDSKYLGGSKYFLLLIDNYSRMMWCVMSKIRFDAFEAFDTFKAIGVAEKNLKIRFLRTNQTSELNSREFSIFPLMKESEEIRPWLIISKACKRVNVIHMKTWERLLILLNRASTKNLECKILYEAWTCVNHQIYNLRVFRCVICVKLSSDN